jgi:hypothetical protein
MVKVSGLRSAGEIRVGSNPTPRTHFFEEKNMSDSEEEPPQPKVSAKEKKALREFCMVSLQDKEAQKQEKIEKKEGLTLVKDRKTKLDEWIRKQGSKCFSVPKAKYKAIEAELSAQGLPPLPIYIRLKKNTTDGTITPDVVEEAIQEITWEALEELEGDLPSKLTQCILNNLRQTIRTSRESVALSDKLEKGQKIVDVPDIDDEALEYMVEMHKTQCALKSQAKEKKVQNQETKTALKQLEAVVDTVLTKTNKTVQPVTLDGIEGSHKIVKKLSTKSQKLTIKSFQDILAESIEEMELPSDSTEASWKKVEQQKVQLIKLILIKINTLPKKESVSIKLTSKLVVDND